MHWIRPWPKNKSFYPSQVLQLLFRSQPCKQSKLLFNFSQTSIMKMAFQMKPTLRSKIGPCHEYKLMRTRLRCPNIYLIFHGTKSPEQLLWTFSNKFSAKIYNDCLINKSRLLSDPKQVCSTAAISIFIFTTTKQASRDKFSSWFNRN